MKSDNLDLVRDISITPDHWDVPVCLCVDNYARFCRRMDGQLQRLVARWQHKSAGRIAVSLRQRIED